MPKVIILRSMPLIVSMVFFVVGVCNHNASVGRSLEGKFPERMFDIVKVFEKVDVVAFHVHDDGNRGEKFQK